MHDYKYRENDTYFRLMYLRIGLVAIITFILAAKYDVFESVAQYVEMHEAYNLDEIIIVGVVLLLFLSIEMSLLIVRIQKQSKTIHMLSIKDQLTDIYNKRGFMAVASSRINELSKLKEQKDLGLIYVDIKGFKKN